MSIFITRIEKSPKLPRVISCSIVTKKEVLDQIENANIPHHE